MKSIHQIVAGFGPGDAISNQAIAMQDIFHSWGYESRVYTEPKRIAPQFRDRADNTTTLTTNCDKNDIAILHLSIGSPVNDVFAKLPCKKVILYHNVTPSHYFDLTNQIIAKSLKEGRQQVEALAHTADINMAVSQFNAKELTDLGYNNVKVLPLTLDLKMLDSISNINQNKHHNDNKVTILFVGRCAPNKKIEDLLDAFYHFNKFVEPRSRLIHVGSFSGAEAYYSLLLARTHMLGIKQHVQFTGIVHQDRLNELYRNSDIFLCMSEHEGFCIPIFEAMANDLPVVAYSAAALPETMDGAGILFTKKDYPQIAEILKRTAHDQDFRAAIIKEQRARLQRHTTRNLPSELKKHINTLL